MEKKSTLIDDLAKNASNGRVGGFLASKIAQTQLSNGTKKWIMFIWDIFYNLVLILGIVVIIRSFIMSPFRVSGPSMCNTLNYINEQCQQSDGEYIIINKLGYLNIFGWKIGEPQRGDVIVLQTPYNAEEYFIKRIIGLPGETIRLQSGYVYVYNTNHPNGVKLNETYLNEENQGNTHPLYKNYSEFTVPEGKYLTFGDNRTHSSDSRSCLRDNLTGVGCESPSMSPYLDKSLIQGKAAVALWPIPRFLTGHEYKELE